MSVRGVGVVGHVFGTRIQGAADDAGAALAGGDVVSAGLEALWVGTAGFLDSLCDKMDAEDIAAGGEARVKVSVWPLARVVAGAFL